VHSDLIGLFQAEIMEEDEGVGSEVEDMWDRDAGFSWDNPRRDQWIWEEENGEGDFKDRAEDEIKEEVEEIWE
jgi:hypothetical protein